MKNSNKTALFYGIIGSLGATGITSLISYLTPIIEQSKMLTQLTIGAGLLTLSIAILYLLLCTDQGNKKYKQTATSEEKDE